MRWFPWLKTLDDLSFSHFSHHWDKIPNACNVTKKFIFAHSCQGTWSMVGWFQGRRAWEIRLLSSWHPVSREQREEPATSTYPSRSCFCPDQTPHPNSTFSHEHWLFSVLKSMAPMKSNHAWKPHLWTHGILGDILELNNNNLSLQKNIYQLVLWSCLTPWHEYSPTTTKPWTSFYTVLRLLLKIFLIKFF